MSNVGIIAKLSGIKISFILRFHVRTNASYKSQTREE